MYILSVDLNWFFTIPGILISLGVILLIIALILFITGYKKSKIEEKLTVQSGVPNSNIEVSPVANNNINVVGVVPTVPAEAFKFEEVQVGVPGIDPINVNANIEEINPIQSQEETIKIEAPEAVGLDKTMATVYGGVSPSDVVIENKEEVPVTIYGGNDPLEATQNLPKVDEHHEPYSGAINNVQFIESSDINSVNVPQVEPIEVQTVETREEPVAVEISSEAVEIVNDPSEVPNLVPGVTTEVKEEVQVVDNVSQDNPENSSEVIKLEETKVEEISPIEIPVAPIEIPSAPIEIPSEIKEVSNEISDIVSEQVKEEVPVVSNASLESVETKDEHTKVEEL